jgi:hypothetical protein
VRAEVAAAPLPAACHRIGCLRRSGCACSQTAMILAGGFRMTDGARAIGGLRGPALHPAARAA